MGLRIVTMRRMFKSLELKGYIRRGRVLRLKKGRI